MQNNSLSNEDIYTFLSNAQNITKRAVRLNEEQSNDRFEREAMGALMQSAGYDLKTLLAFINTYPKVFDFEENIKKLKAIESLSTVLGSNFSFSLINRDDNFKMLVGF